MINKQIIRKFVILLFVSALLGILSRMWGFNSQQALAIAIFSASVLGTVLFWDMRLSIAFIGASLLLMTKTINFEHFLKFASFEIILFLIGMMILSGFLKDSNFFIWIVTLMLRVKNFTAIKFTIIISVMSAVFSCAVGEVTSIIFMVMAVLEICDFLEVNPTPFVLISVLATNIGSAGTVLGNPVGILIAAKSGLTFEDFLVKAFPVMWLILIAAIVFLIIWFRKPLKEMDAKIKEHGANDMLIKLISVPPDKQQIAGITLLLSTVFLISMHHRIELFLGLESNTMLFIIPILAAAVVMIWRSHRVLHYIEEDVEWMTLLFFIFFFAQAGTLQYTNASGILADKLLLLTGNNINILTPVILWVSSITSSMLDNVVVVASFIPVIQSFQIVGPAAGQKMWWALLFGACLGGNITIIGSTANIVALGLIEKERKIKIRFLQWFKPGLAVGVFTTAIVWLYLLIV
ncbi:MAG: hypothetical protein JW946_03970 [Candidatus Omnitrophica bacterium]|nr:hypothetical protein [Candidatus Omnitrophota bacterium]